MSKKKRLYLQVELEVLDLLEPMGALSGRTPAEMLLGLCRIWRWCWLHGTAEVPTRMIDGFLPGGLEALEVFGFLTKSKTDVIVRGCERYGKVRAGKVRRALQNKEPKKGPNDDKRTQLGQEMDQRGPISAPVGPESVHHGAQTDLKEPKSEQVPIGTEYDSKGTKEGPKGPSLAQNGTKVGLFGPGDIEILRDRDTENTVKSFSSVFQTEAAFIEKLPKKRKEKKLSTWEELWCTLQELRTDRLETLGLEEEETSAPQALKPARVNHLLSGAASWLKEHDPEGNQELADVEASLTCMWKVYLWSRYWSGRQPAFPLEGFCAPSTLLKIDNIWCSPKDPIQTLETW